MILLNKIYTEDNHEQMESDLVKVVLKFIQDRLGAEMNPDCGLRMMLEYIPDVNEYKERYEG